MNDCICFVSDEKTIENLKKMSTQSNSDLENDIYYRRELLINSLEGRRIDLLTITSFHRIRDACESRMDDLFPDQTVKRCRLFENKKVKMHCNKSYWFRSSQLDE